MILLRPLDPVPRWNASSLSIGPMDAASGLKADVESIPNWNLPSLSTNIV